MSKTVFEQITQSKEDFVDWLLGNKEALELPGPDGTGTIVVSIGVDILLGECSSECSGECSGECEECEDFETCRLYGGDEDEAALEECDECYEDLAPEEQELIRGALLEIFGAEVCDD